MPQVTRRLCCCVFCAQSDGKEPAFRVTVSQNNDTCLREAQCCVLGVGQHQPRAGTQVQLPGSSAQPSRPWRGGRWKCLVRGDQHREILAQQKSYCPNQDLPKDGKSRSSWTLWSRSNVMAKEQRRFSICPDHVGLTDCSLVPTGRSLQL